LQLFLAEAVVLSLAGGMLGVGSAVALIWTVQLLLPSLPVAIAWSYVGIALLLALIIGLVTGIIPARRAAAMQPLDALRTE
jgi:putative ABC transport system permease protein